MSDRLHELRNLVRDMAVELEQTPTLSDLNKLGITKHEIVKLFGGMTQLIHACDLDPEVKKKKKIDNSIFEKDIRQHLEEYEPKEKAPYIRINPIHTIILGDTHFPFVHQDKLKKAIDYIKLKKPKRVIQVGDLYDMLSHGKFPRSLNVYTPAEEMSEGRKLAAKMWADIQKAVPGVECHQILGNHDLRPMKRIIEQYPEAELFFDFSKWFQFDGVTSHMDVRQELILEGIAYIHGYRSRLGEHMEYMRRPVVCGHSHKGGVFYKNFGDDVLFELNAGYLGDPDSKALSYTAQKHTHSTHGIGEVDFHGPRFIVL